MTKYNNSKVLAVFQVVSHYVGFVTTRSLGVRLRAFLCLPVHFHSQGQKKTGAAYPQTDNELIIGNALRCPTGDNRQLIRFTAN